MKLEWFRHHKKFVYWILLPVVGIGMAFFGATSAIESRRSHSGPSVRYTVNGRTRNMSASEVVALRFLLTQFGQGISPWGYPQRGDHHIRTSDEAAMHQVAFHTAAQAGFNIGKDEARDKLMEEIKGQILQRDGSTPTINEKVYDKLLSIMQISPPQFERLVRDFSVLNKYFGYLSQQSLISDPELFLAFCREKEVVRMRYKEFKSEDFMAQTKEPSEEKVRKFYDDNKKNVTDDLKDVMFTKPTLSADVLFMDTSRFFTGDANPTDAQLQKIYDENKATWKLPPAKAGEPDKFKPFSEVKSEVEAKWRDQESKNFIKPEEKDLQNFYDENKEMWKIEAKQGEAPKYKEFKDVKAEVEAKWRETESKKFYDRRKAMFWKIEPKAGEPPPKPGEEKVKPYEEVKADVEKKWYEDWQLNQLGSRPRAKMTALRNEFQKDEEAWKKEQENKKPEERKPFDLDDWAKKHNLVHWTTDALTEDQYRAGKREANAKDFANVGSLFFLKKPSQYQSLNEANEKRAREFEENPQILFDKGNKGLTVSRIKEYKAEEAMPFEQAKKPVAERLKVNEAIELAEKEAKKVHDAWAEGKELPPIDSLLEARGDKEAKQDILRKFFSNPKQVGDVIDVAQGPVESPGYGAPPNPHERFYVGFAVERELPTWQTFNQDATTAAPGKAFSRDTERDQIAREDYIALIRSMLKRMEDQAERDRSLRDAPLFDEARGRHADDDQ